MLNHKKKRSRHITVEEVTQDSPGTTETSTPDTPPAEEAGIGDNDLEATDGTICEETLYEASNDSQDSEGTDDDALLAAVSAYDMEDDEGHQDADGEASATPPESKEVPPQVTEPPAEDAVAKWTSLMPDCRIPEASFVAQAFDTSLSVDQNGNLMAPVTVGDWTMLLVYDKKFPSAAEQGPVARLYFVSPTPEEITRVTGIPVDAFSVVGDGTERYLIVDDFDKFCQAYRSGRARVLMAERLLRAASELRVAYEEAKEASNRTWARPTLTRSRYTDTRSTTPGAPRHPLCQKVVLSNRAFVQIYNETQAHINTETGGLLLGHFENGVWYVVEAGDPGWDAVFQPSYHEANEDYENHIGAIMSRTYRHPLAFLGMWHRHPGSLDTFSGTDDATNSKYVDSCGNGCISALINYDPDYRITFYYVERAQGNGVTYYQVDVEVGDDKFANQEILQVAGVPGGARGVLSQPTPLPRDVRTASQGSMPPVPPSERDRLHRRPKKGKQSRGGRPNGPSGGFFMMFPRF